MEICLDQYPNEIIRLCKYVSKDSDKTMLNSNKHKLQRV